MIKELLIVILIFIVAVLTWLTLLAVFELGYFKDSYLLKYSLFFVPYITCLLVDKYG